MDYRARQRRLTDLLPKERVDALLVTHMPNVRYLCGFTGSSGVLVIFGGGGARPIFVTDGRYTGQARSEVAGARVVIAQGPTLAEAVKRVPARSVLGIEAEHMTVAARAAVLRLLPAGVRLKNVAGLIERLRMIKEPEEIACLRAAVLMGSSLFEKVLPTIRPGVPESTIAGELEFAARRAGADGMSFDTLVASGLRSALPHGRA